MIVHEGGRWYVRSETGGKNLGDPEGYTSEEEAKQRLAQIEAFKNMKHDCKRYDLGTYAKPKRMPNGFLRADARLTRTGVFVYRNADGTERRELRLPEEVFKRESLDTLSLVPVTDEHPPEFLTAENARKYTSGSVSERVTQDDKFVTASLMFTDGELIKAVEKGAQQQLSCGYTCDLEQRSGVSADGEKYDAVQRNIVYNHVAATRRGRAGPEVRVRMDSAASQMLSISETGPRPASEGSHVKIRIDGVDYEAGSKEAADAQVAYQTKLEATAAEQNKAQNKARVDAEAKQAEELKAAKDAAEKAQAKADALEVEKKKLDAELKDAPKKITEQLKSRMVLEGQAASVLGKKEKLDGLSDKEIKLAVLKKLDPDFDPKGRSDAYVDARFEFVLEAEREDDDEGNDDDDDDVGAGEGRRVVQDEDDGNEEPGSFDAEMSDEEANAPHKDSVTARAAMLHRHRTAWKQPVNDEK